MERIRLPPEYENNSFIILDDLSEKEINNDKIQAMFKRGRHKYLPISIVNQNYYELPKRKIRLMEISITCSNQTISEMFKISIKIKFPWK